MRRDWPTPQPMTFGRKPLNVWKFLLLFCLSLMAGGAAVWTVGSFVRWLIP